MWHMCETEREGDRAISAVSFEKSTHTLLGQDHTEGLSHGDYSAYCYGGIELQCTRMNTQTCIGDVYLASFKYLTPFFAQMVDM